MNKDTSNRIDEREFLDLFGRILKRHRPIKAALSTEHLAALGAVVFKFSRLEFGLLRLASCFSDKQLSMTLPYSRLIDVLREHKDKDGDLDLLTKAAGDAGDIRNRVIHSIWAGGKSPNMEAVRFKAPHKTKMGPDSRLSDSEQFTLAELERVAAWIDKVDTVVEGYWFRLHEEQAGIS